MRRLFILLFLLSACFPNQSKAQGSDTLNGDLGAVLSGYPFGFEILRGAIVVRNNIEERYVSKATITGAKSTEIVGDRHWGGLYRIVAMLGTTNSKEAAKALFDSWTNKVKALDFIGNHFIETDYKDPPKTLVYRSRWIFPEASKVNGMFKKINIQLETWEDANGVYTTLLKFGEPQNEQ